MKRLGPLCSLSSVFSSNTISGGYHCLLIMFFSAISHCKNPRIRTDSIFNSSDDLKFTINILTVSFEDVTTRVNNLLVNYLQCIYRSDILPE